MLMCAKVNIRYNMKDINTDINSLDNPGLPPQAVLGVRSSRF